LGLTSVRRVHRVSNLSIRCFLCPLHRGWLDELLHQLPHLFELRGEFAFALLEPADLLEHRGRRLGRFVRLLILRCLLIGLLERMIEFRGLDRVFRALCVFRTLRGLGLNGILGTVDLGNVWGLRGFHFHFGALTPMR